jgi:hypothetical protein
MSSSYDCCGVFDDTHKLFYNREQTNASDEHTFVGEIGREFPSGSVFDEHFQSRIVEKIVFCQPSSFLC